MSESSMTARARWTRSWRRPGRVLVLVGAIGVSGAFFSTLSPYFLTFSNLETVLKNAVDLAVISAGMTMVIIMGAIDVSVGGILAVTAIFIGRAYQGGLSDWLVVPIGLAAGTALGVFNGAVVARLKVPPIIATLGTMYIFLAVMFLVIGGRWIAGLPGTLSPLVSGSLLGVPSAVIVIGFVYGACWVLLRHQAFGRHLCAVGSNEQSARLSGINVDRVKILNYALLGLLAGFGALLYVARLRNVEINIGTNIALEAIAATVLGGTSIRGGVGSLLGTLLGVVFIKLVQNGLVLIGVSSLWETVIIGGLLIFVLTVDAVQNRHLRQAL